MGAPLGIGAANADAGASRIAIASDRGSKHARTAMRKQLTDILYPGAFTSRQKRYAAEPAPDMANLTLIDERTANGRPKTRFNETPTAGTDRPIARRFRREGPHRAPRSCRAAASPASGMFRTPCPRSEMFRQNWCRRPPPARCDA